eukprot:scaffold93367_cov77-Attheya_sp.AAC.1
MGERSGVRLVVDVPSASPISSMYAVGCYFFSNLLSLLLTGPPPLPLYDWLCLVLLCTMSIQFPAATAPSSLLCWPVDSLHHTTPFVPGARSNRVDMVVLVAKEFLLHYLSSKDNPHEIQAC